MANSYNGWPASPDGGSISIVQISVAGSRPFNEGGYAGGVKGGDVATIFQYLITRLHNEVEPMMTQPGSGLVGYGCWGYQYRANVNNPSQLSCHASGSAIDYNAPRHANGTSVGSGGGGGWSAEQYRKIQAILAALGGVVRWLTSNDPMHFEIGGSVAAVAVVAARIRIGGTIPTSPPVDPPEDDSMSAADVEALKTYIDAKFEELPTRVWTKGITGNDPGQRANALLAQAASHPAPPPVDYEVVIYEDKGGLWWSEGGVSTAIPDPATLRGMEAVAKQSGKDILYWPGGDVDLPGAFGARGGVIPGPDVVPPPPKTYTVVQGDTFNAVAGKFGLNPDQLGALNPQVTNRAQINIGDVLTVSP